jgi:hypothetical protein
MNKIIRLQRIEIGNESLIRVTYKNWLFGTITNRDIYDDKGTVLNWRFCDNDYFARPYKLFDLFIRSGSEDYIVNGEIYQKDLIRSGGSLTIIS